MTPALFRLASLCVLGATIAGCSAGRYPPHPLGLPYVNLASYPSPIQPTAAAAPPPVAMPAPPPAPVVPADPVVRQETNPTASAYRPSGLPGLQHVDLASYPSPIPAQPARAHGAPKTAAGTTRTAPSRPAAATPPEAPAARSQPWTPPAATRSSSSYAQDMERMRRIEEDARRDSELRMEAMAREMERDRQERERQREQDRRDQEYREAALRDQIERDRRYHEQREQERERERDRERERERERERDREREQSRRDQERRDQANRDQARREQAERDRRAEEERRNRETRPAQMAPGSYTPDPKDWRARQQSNSSDRP